MAQTLFKLLPKSLTWARAKSREFVAFVDALQKAFDDAKDFVVDVYEDLFAGTTAQLQTWENETGLRPFRTEGDRRDALDRELRDPGGQNPNYLQQRLQDEGFDLYVHECWESIDPFVARDPRDYAVLDPIEWPLCTDEDEDPDWDQAQCTDEVEWGQAQCVGYMSANYFDNLIPQTEVPPIPDDPDTWPFFLYLGGSTFGTPAVYPAERKGELYRLVAKHRPLRHWPIFLTETDPELDLLIWDDGDWDDEPLA